MINVLIVEDDPMVAELNKRFLSKVDGYSLVDISPSVEDAIIKMENNLIHLILLDVHMPGKTGFDLLSAIREKDLGIDVILITAASDVEKIQKALRKGAIDYLIKPFEFVRFKEALIRYKEKFEVFHQSERLSQKELDRKLFKSEQETIRKRNVLPKGLSERTLLLIVENIKKLKSFSTDEIAEITSISRVSVRNYLKFLADKGVLEETLIYGKGRPVYHYKYNGNDEVLKEYLE